MKFRIKVNNLNRGNAGLGVSLIYNDGESYLMIMFIKVAVRIGWFIER